MTCSQNFTIALNFVWYFLSMKDVITMITGSIVWFKRMKAITVLAADWPAIIHSMTEGIRATPRKDAIQLKYFIYMNV